MYYELYWDGKKEGEFETLEQAQSFIAELSSRSSRPLDLRIQEVKEYCTLIVNEEYYDGKIFRVLVKDPKRLDLNRNYFWGPDRGTNNRLWTYFNRRVLTPCEDRESAILWLKEKYPKATIRVQEWDMKEI